MAWRLTPERRNAVLLQLLGKALRALESASDDEDQRRVARLWIERATEVAHDGVDVSETTLHNQCFGTVEQVLEKIAARLEDAPEQTMH